MDSITKVQMVALLKEHYKDADDCILEDDAFISDICNTLDIKLGDFIPGRDMEEVLGENGGQEELMRAVLFDEIHAPTRCPHYCEVEPDGKCSHGYLSVIRELGMI